MYDKVKQWYDWGLWTKQMVHDVVPDLSTPEEYESITGDPDIPDEPDETKEKAEAFDILMGEDNE